MFVMDRGKNQVVLMRNGFFLGVGITIIVMFIMGVCLLMSMEPFEDMNTFMDYFGVAFIGIWLLGLLAGGIYTLETNSRRIVINDWGIACRSWFVKDSIQWTDVADWGLSYCGQTKGEGNTYYLYFSKHPCSVKDDCRKRLKGKMIRTFIMESEYEETVSKLIPFCKERTAVEPFVGVDKFHFLF